MRRSKALAALLGAGLCLASAPASTQEDAFAAGPAEPAAAEAAELPDPDVEAAEAWWARSASEDEAWWAGVPENTPDDHDAWWATPTEAQVAAADTADGDAATLEEEEEADDPRRSCATLRKQIAHFEGVKALAAHRGDEAWEQGTALHLERLRAQQMKQCPEDVPPNAGQQIAAFAAQAALIAYQLFMMGLL
ncbi:MAG: hypothetical protein JSU66_11060 [Deltaproteobacteria bacterium]|nr:MAG: hypothetical protein JSU66_11060 [Deltaproteobacteria bacterium]